MDDMYIPKKKAIHISTNVSSKRKKKRKKAIDELKNYNQKIDKQRKNAGISNKTNKPKNYPNSKKVNNYQNNKKKNVTKDKLTQTKTNIKLPKIEVKEEQPQIVQEPVKEEKQITIEKPKEKKKNSNFIRIILILLLTITISTFGTTIFYKIEEQRKNSIKKRNIQAETALVAKINSHFNKKVKTTKDTPFYIIDEGKYIEKGIIYEDVSIKLEETDVNIFTEYFKIENKDYFISYKDVLPDESEDEVVDNRYKRYIPFNENIVTKEGFTLYNDTKKMYSFNESMQFPIIIKDFENRYYVEYDGMFLSIEKDDVLETVYAYNTDQRNQSRITTLAYHRVYKPGDECSDSYTCIKYDNFDMEMKYLKDNNYFTLTMPEMYMYLNGNVQVNNAVVLTFDDGLLMDNTIEILEKYDLDGTVFVITSFFYDFSCFKSDNLLVQSHGDDLHRAYVCSGGMGGAILCENEEKIKNDLRTSIEKIGNPSYAFAYPFYDYNNRAIRILKEVGFKMAFAGRLGTMGRSSPHGVDLYKIPRMTVWDFNLMSFNTWKSYL